MTPTGPVAAPPPRNPRQRRYPMSLVTMARRMYGDGDSWTPTQIRDYLARAHGASGLTLGTVRRWVLPQEAAEQRAANRAAATRRRASPDLQQRSFVRWAWLLRLRAEGLSFRGMVIVARVTWGVELDPEVVRYAVRNGRLTPSLANRLDGRAT